MFLLLLDVLDEVSYEKQPFWSLKSLKLKQLHRRRPTKVNLDACWQCVTFFLDASIAFIEVLLYRIPVIFEYLNTLQASVVLWRVLSFPVVVSCFWKEIGCGWLLVSYNSIQSCHGWKVNQNSKSFKHIITWSIVCLSTLPLLKDFV